jgi:putative N6-adenine-specific DNA methylase
VASEIYVSDRDPGAIRATQSNARRAEVDRYVTMRCATLDALPPPGRPGWVISNLPYGQRVGRDADIERFYAQIGHILRDRWVGWRVAFVATATTDPALIHRGLRKSMKFKNGGIPVAVWTGEIG